MWQSVLCSYHDCLPEFRNTRSLPIKILESISLLFTCCCFLASVFLRSWFFFQVWLRGRWDSHWHFSTLGSFVITSNVFFLWDKDRKNPGGNVWVCIFHALFVWNVRVRPYMEISILAVQQNYSRWGCGNYAQNNSSIFSHQQDWHSSKAGRGRRSHKSVGCHNCKKTNRSMKLWGVNSSLTTAKLLPSSNVAGQARQRRVQTTDLCWLANRFSTTL